MNNSQHHIVEIYKMISAENPWKSVAHFRNDSAYLNTIEISKLSKPDGILDNPSFWNIASVLVGGIIAVVCNLLTQAIIENVKSKRNKNTYAMDLAWSIAQGIEYARSMGVTGYIQNQNEAQRQYKIPPSIGSYTTTGNFDIAKIGFLGTVISSEFPPKAQEYINAYALLIAVIEKRNGIYCEKIHPALERIAVFNGNSMEFDPIALEEEAGKIHCLQIKQLTDEIYNLLEYMEANGNALIRQINTGLKQINLRKYLIFRNMNPPKITIRDPDVIVPTISQ